MPHRVPSAAEALKFVQTHGVVLESARGPVPTFVDFAAGEKVSQWWGHPLGKPIFRLTRIIRDSPDIVTCRLIDGKITYIHRRVWPALVKLSRNFNKKDLSAIREEHSPTGKHVLISTPFPRWLPADVIELGEGLSEAEARKLLNAG